MNSLLLALDGIRRLLGMAFAAVGVALALVCLIDWMVRTRRVNPFGKVARFFRESVEPLMAPVERQLVRAGGVPSSAPWWSLAVVVLGGIVVLSLFDFMRGQIAAFHFASQGGARSVVRMLIQWTFALLRMALIVRVVCSWIRVSPYSRWVRWAFTLSEPILRPLRQVVPTLGLIDITPIVAYLLLSLLERVVVSLT